MLNDIDNVHDELLDFHGAHSSHCDNHSWPGRITRSVRQLNLRPAPELKPRFPILCAYTAQVPTSTLGRRMVATSTKKTRTARRPYISSSFKLRTLRPEQLSIMDQMIIDLSGKVRAMVPILIDNRALQCIHYDIRPTGGTPNRLYMRFPENTNGFFYYHNPAGGSEFYAGVRFRICESAAEFEHGRDLLDSRGDAWGPKILQLVKLQEWAGLLSLLRTENLVDEALINDIHNFDISERVRHYCYLLSDPFYLNFAQRKCWITYVTRAKLVRLFLRQNIFAAWNGTSYTLPLTGTIKVQFELSDLPEHRKLGPTLVIRVLEVVDPILVDPLFTGDSIPPIAVPGTLLLRNLYKRSDQVVHIPLKRQRNADDLLELARVSWPGM